MRPLLLSLIPLALWPVSGCGQAEDGPAMHAMSAPESTAPAPSDGVLGTISATLDGTERTWYVVEGKVGGKPYASATWLEANGALLISIGGFDTRTPPLETFRIDMAAGDISFGDYDGSAMQILVSVTDGEHTARSELPADHGGRFSAAYLPVVGSDMLTGTLMIEEGAMEVTDARLTDRTASVRGTFRGTFRRVNGSGDSLSVENGRFEVSGIPPRDQLTGS